jgi:protein-S-isoprenylcysteine O-methyltransferase Ste14
MELKVPPVLVFLSFAIVMYLVSLFLPVGFFDFFGRFILAKILLLCAGLIGLVSLFQFFRNKTTVDPMNPEKVNQLVTSGLYKYSRNPMYLALLMVLLALGLYLGNAFNTLVAAGFVGYMNRFQIIPEERILLARFGKDFKSYQIATRRWF